MNTQVLSNFMLSKKKTLQITGGEEDKPKLKKKFESANSKVESTVIF